MATHKRSRRHGGSQRAAGAARILLCLILACGTSPAVDARPETGGRNEVTYTSPDGFRVFATYCQPPVPSDRAVIIFPDAKEGRRGWDSIADTLSRHGLHVLVPDLRGTGESVFQRGIRRERAYFSESELRASAADATPALRFVRRLPGTTIRTIVLVGSGTGTPPALQGVSRERGPRILISPRPMREAHPDSSAPADPGPWLTVVGRDDVLGIEAAAGWIGQDPSRECWIVDGAGQGSELIRTRIDLVTDLVRWIDRATGRP